MNRNALIAGAGCLGCIGVPSLLAIGAAGGYFFAATRENPSVAIVERAPERIAVAPVRESAREADVDTWETDSRRLRSDDSSTPRPVVKELAPRDLVIATPSAREVAVATPVVKELAKVASPISTPARIAAPVATPVAMAKLASPITPPVAKELAKVAAPIATPAAVLKKLSAPIETAKAAPIPKSTPRNFDEPELKMTKPVKTSVASNGAGAAPSATEEDVAVAALFGDAPGSSVPAAVAPAAAAPAASNAKIRTIKTKGGPVQVTLGKKIAIQGADSKAVLGTLEKVEGGWVALRLGDGKVKIIAETDVVDASEL